MIHSYKLRLPQPADKELLFNTLHTLFTQENFKVERKDDLLTFEKMTERKGVSRHQVIFELLKGLPAGIICVDMEAMELTCKINYNKQLIVSLIIGGMISFVFSIFGANFITLLWKAGLPIVGFFLLSGWLNGNSKVEEVVNKAAASCGLEKGFNSLSIK